PVSARYKNNLDSAKKKKKRAEEHLIMSLSHPPVSPQSSKNSIRLDYLPVQNATPMESQPSVTNESTAFVDREKKLPKQKKKRHPLRKITKLIWLPEVTSFILAFAAVLAIIILLANRQDKPLPDWPSVLGINALVAIFSSVSKAALLFTVAECIGELRWIWFAKERPLSDIDRFDAASRGPWGSLMLLVKRPRNIAATLGALITILTLAVDPFTQQILQFRNCLLPDTSVARIARTNNYTEGVYTVSLGTPSVNKKMTGTLFQGLLNPPSNAFALVATNCETGNCTFPHSDDHIAYNSLAMCSSVEDISNTITGHGSDADSSYETWNWTLPSGLRLLGNSALSTAPVKPTASENGAYILETQFAVDCDEKSSPDCPIPPEENSPLFVLETLMVVSDCGFKDPQDCSTTPFAIRAFLSPCIQAYGHVNITNAEFEEHVMSTTMLPFNSVLGFYSLAGDYPSQPGIDCAPSEYRTDNKTMPTEHLASGLRSIKLPSDDDDDDDAESANTTWYNPACTYAFSYGPTRGLPATLSNTIFGDPSGYPKNVSLPRGPSGQTIGDAWILALYNDGQADMDTTTAYFDGLANSISATMREDPSDGEPARGTTLRNQTCVGVAWGWIALPVLLVVMTLVLITVTIVLSGNDTRVGGRAEGRRAWKSSSLPLLWCGLGDGTRERYERFDEVEKMKECGDGVMVRNLDLWVAKSARWLYLYRERTSNEGVQLITHMLAESPTQMTNETQFSLSLELAKIFPIGHIIKSGAEELVSLVRALRKDGSDFLVEEDLANIFGRGRIEPSLEADFRKAVRVGSIQPLHADSTISLDSGPGATLSFLMWFHEATTLAAALVESMLSRYFSNVQGATPDPDYESILKTLQACSSQTSQFPWENFSALVGSRFPKSIQQFYEHDSPLKALRQNLLLGAMDYLYMIQSLPDDRLVLINGPSGLVPMVIWAHYILGLTVLIKNSPDGDVVFGSAKNPQVMISWDSGPALNSTKSDRQLFTSPGPRVVSSTPDIYFLDADMHVLLVAEINEYNGAELQGLEIHRLKGYGTTYLRRLFNTHRLLADDNPIYTDTANFAISYAILLSQKMRRQPLSGHTEAVRGTSKTFVYEDIPEQFHLSTPHWRILNSSQVIFWGIELEKRKIVGNVDKLNGRDLRDMPLPASLSSYLEEPEVRVLAGRIDPEQFIVLKLASWILMFAQVIGIESCHNLPLRILPDLATWPRISSWSNESTIGITPSFWFDLVKEMMSKDARMINQPTPAAHTSSADLGNLFLTSHQGWSLFYSSIGDNDPEEIICELLCIKPGVPTNMRTGEQKNRIVDAPRITPSYYEHVHLDKKDTYVPSRGPRAPQSDNSR
ncbi:MAG: hypothetical protein Q9169_006879, partial [Polycauliona sp. 2 TL-2023]